MFEGYEEFTSCTYGFWVDMCNNEEDDESCYAYVTFQGEEYEGHCDELEEMFGEYMPEETEGDYSDGSDWEDCKFVEISVNGAQVDQDPEKTYWLSYNECDVEGTVSCDIYHGGE